MRNRGSSKWVRLEIKIYLNGEDPCNSLYFISHLLFDNRKVYGKLIKIRFRIKSDFLTTLSENRPVRLSLDHKVF